MGFIVGHGVDQEEEEGSVAYTDEKLDALLQRHAAAVGDTCSANELVGALRATRESLETARQALRTESRRANEAEARVAELREALGRAGEHPPP